MIAAEILGLAPWELALAVFIVFVGSATQASIGIGLGLMAAPTLSLIDTSFIPGAIAISVVPLGVGMAAREWDHVDPAIYRAVVGRVAGVLIGAWAVATTYGLVDELHQSYVPGRDCSLFDLVSDAAGAALAVALLRGLLDVSPSWRREAVMALGFALFGVLAATYLS